MTRTDGLGTLLNVDGSVFMKERSLGCPPGSAIGDALGGPSEFCGYCDVHHRCGDPGVKGFLLATYGFSHGVGLISDDTQMILFIFGCIIQLDGVPWRVESRAIN